MKAHKNRCVANDNEQRHLSTGGDTCQIALGGATQRALGELITRELKCDCR